MVVDSLFAALTRQRRHSMLHIAVPKGSPSSYSRPMRISAVLFPYYWTASVAFGPNTHFMRRLYVQSVHAFELYVLSPYYCRIVGWQLQLLGFNTHFIRRLYVQSEVDFSLYLWTTYHRRKSVPAPGVSVIICSTELFNSALIPIERKNRPTPSFKPACS